MTSVSIEEALQCWCSVQCVLEHGDERRVVGSDVLARSCLGVDQHTFTLVVLLVLEQSDFESSGCARISVDVVRELAWVDFLDFGNSRSDLWFVASATAVKELDGVGSVCFNLMF